MFFVLIIINIFYLYQCKNIILPFKKISIEDFNGENTINDLITFNIYTNISMGTPPQIVAHFIDQNDYSLHFEKRMLSYNRVKTSKILGDMGNITNFWFNRKKSTTFTMNNDNGICSDVYYFYNSNDEIIKIDEFKYNIYLSDMQDKYKCGIIGLNNPLNAILNISVLLMN